MYTRLLLYAPHPVCRTLAVACVFHDDHSFYLSVHYISLSARRDQDKRFSAFNGVQQFVLGMCFSKNLTVDHFINPKDPEHSLEFPHL